MPIFNFFFSLLLCPMYIISNQNAPCKLLHSAGNKLRNSSFIFDFAMCFMFCY